MWCQPWTTGSRSLLVRCFYEITLVRRWTTSYCRYSTERRLRPPIIIFVEDRTLGEAHRPKTPNTTRAFIFRRHLRFSCEHGVVHYSVPADDKNVHVKLKHLRASRPTLLSTRARETTGGSSVEFIFQTTCIDHSSKSACHIMNKFLSTSISILPIT